MATATFVKEGRGVTTGIYNAPGAVAADEIVIAGDAGAVSVGVAREATAAAGPVVVAFGGVWSFPKVSGAVIKAGESVNWDADAEAVDDNQATPATDDAAGFARAIEDAGSGTTTVKVELLGPVALTA